jgi:molybdate transport system permease protein
MSDLGPFWLSLRVAALATMVIVAAGMPIALLLARTRFPGKGLVAGILVLPLVLPPTVLGF